MDPESANVSAKVCEVSVNLRRFDRNLQPPQEQQTMYNCKPSTSAAAAALPQSQVMANSSLEEKSNDGSNTSSANESIRDNESNTVNSSSKKSNHNGDSESDSNNSSPPILRKRRRASRDNGDHQTFDNNAKSTASPKTVKAKRRQVAFERKMPTKANSSAAAAAASSLKTLKKYRNTRNSNTAGTPDKISPRSPLKARVMPQRKPKTELQTRQLCHQGSEDAEDGAKDGLQSRKTGKSSEQEKKPESEEDEELAAWLNSNSHEEYDLRPRAAAIAAAKKGKLGAGVVRTSRAKIGRVFRAPRERVPKGRSRHALKKRAAKPKPIRCVANDNEMTFRNSLFCGQTYFQVGDIVSIYSDDGLGPYYLQIRLLCTDEYFREIASLRWLVPKTPFATKLPFDARNYKHCSPTEKDVTRFLTDVTLIAHCPLEYFSPLKDILYNRLEKGTIYIRMDQSLAIMGTEKVDFPELKAFREKQRKELEEIEKLEKEEEAEGETEKESSASATTIGGGNEHESTVMPPAPSHVQAKVSTLNDNDDESKIMPPPAPPTLASSIIDESKIMPPPPPPSPNSTKLPATE